MTIGRIVGQQHGAQPGNGGREACGRGRGSRGRARAKEICPFRSTRRCLRVLVCAPLPFDYFAVCLLLQWDPGGPWHTELDIMPYAPPPVAAQPRCSSMHFTHSTMPCSCCCSCITSHNTCPVAVSRTPRRWPVPDTCCRMRCKPCTCPVLVGHVLCDVILVHLSHVHALFLYIPCA